MQHSTENVVLFPKWKKTLENNSLEAIKHKEYEKALSNLDKLLSYHVNNHEIIIGKMICLMELGRYETAQDYCEQVLEYKSDINYYHYLHIYLTILFQTSQYDLLMDHIAKEFESNEMPKRLRQQFQQLYDISEQMKSELNIKKHTEYINDLQQAIEDENHILQWRLVESIRKMKVDPPKMIIPLLQHENIHPVTKTSIFFWLQERNYTKEVSLHKLNLKSTVNPSKVPNLQSNATVKQTKLLISELEQNNPSLFSLIMQVLHRFVYVRYPIMYPKEDINEIAKALKYIGSQYLNIHTNSSNILNDKTVYYVEEIKKCEALYLSIIED